MVSGALFQAHERLTSSGELMQQSPRIPTTNHCSSLLMLESLSSIRIVRGAIKEKKKGRRVTPQSEEACCAKCLCGQTRHFTNKLVELISNIDLNIDCLSQNDTECH